MKKLVRKDKLRRIKVYKFEDVRLILKSLASNNYLPIMIRWNAFVSLTKLISDSSKIKLTKRCVISYRRNVASHKFKFSRLAFARLIKIGRTYGIKKVSW